MGEKVAVAFEPALRFRPVGDRRNPSRLDEANNVWRDSHAHVVPSAQQLAPDGGAGLDIAASSPHRQHKPHCVSKPSTYQHVLRDKTGSLPSAGSIIFAHSQWNVATAVRCTKSTNPEAFPWSGSLHAPALRRMSGLPRI